MRELPKGPGDQPRMHPYQSGKDVKATLVIGTSDLAKMFARLAAEHRLRPSSEWSIAFIGAKPINDFSYWHYNLLAGMVAGQVMRLVAEKSDDFFPVDLLNLHPHK